MDDLDFIISIDLNFISGLWHVCLDGYHDKSHQYEIKLHGCMHIRLEEYDFIRSEIQPRK